MRVSSIRMTELVDQFRHILRNIAPELHDFAGEGVLEPQFGRMQRLASETESLEHGAKFFGCAAIGRIPQ